jgi:hypothetical protein
VKALMARLRALRRHRLDQRAQAVCPADAWAFTPLYTGGHCPLCGWTPDGYVHTPPPLTSYDRYWASLAAIAAVSALMLVVVVVAATRH